MIKTNLNPSDYELSDGYVSGMGVNYQQCTPETFDNAIKLAAVKNDKTIDEIIVLLADTARRWSIPWTDSPNYFYDHSVGTIHRIKKSDPNQEKLIKCDCGHSVQAATVMSAMLGTSCPECYDSMNE